MLTLLEVKQSLMIDFPDQDDYITRLLNAATARASTITGISITIDVVDELGNVIGTVQNPLFDTDEINGAILDDIAAMYQERGESVSGSTKSIHTYRRLSVKPAF
jgi:hypothetical protein